ncbi:hypothetical protein B0T22DRAFT_532514 [Podospora appendiculata]|uniref:Uncharacterized protein n=1 Tax=Podospora appendiculata TaxID=314037 RepID=A0AAE0XHR5_9PEZI|nr:hypothetical protein B0T22DRAFT_532514 [Podospora appendiculata]
MTDAPSSKWLQRAQHHQSLISVPQTQGEAPFGGTSFSHQIASKSTTPPKSTMGLVPANQGNVGSAASTSVKPTNALQKRTSVDSPKRSRKCGSGFHSWSKPFERRRFSPYARFRRDSVEHSTRLLLCSASSRSSACPPTYTAELSTCSSVAEMRALLDTALEILRDLDQGGNKTILRCRDTLAQLPTAFEPAGQTPGTVHPSFSFSPSNAWALQLMEPGLFGSELASMCNFPSDGFDVAGNLHLLNQNRGF